MRFDGKRVFDFAASAILSILLLPMMLLVAVVVAVSLGRPLIFRQDRPGLRGRAFTLYKFRTMRNATGPDGRPLPDRERQTRIGNFLRSASLDELPELLNVLKGDMSLVGPRPLLLHFVFTAEQARRHDVRPGLTGLAQVKGRNHIPLSKRIELDLYYVDHLSPWLDLRIMLSTIPIVFGLQGVVRQQTIDDIDDLGLSPNSTVARQRALQPNSDASRQTGV